MKKITLSLLILILIPILIQAQDKTKIWVNKEFVIPTYEIGAPEKNPMFLENRVYQGSSGVVYPYPVIEKISEQKKDKKYKAVFLENKYLKIMILPELGGRIQMAYDKTKKRHFVYYNSVIKPALVGLTGPWISGGIEFNWPQHHRPSTFQETDFSITENEDGSATICINEVERMFRTKGTASFTLYPDKAYLEIEGKIYNRTNQPQTFLWWANPAVHVNDAYQSVFPPDVQAVFDHGKRDVSEYPIAKGIYYKADYTAGVDISRYKNIPVPTSFMATSSEYNFLGGYENDSKGGLLHVANHHISPGKKQWTWGNGDFGQAWDRNLTDNNGPYIELMCGVYTDNQPDFSWIMPYEEKTFKQYFMPYRDLGVVKNATKDAMINFEIIDDKAIVKVYTTSEYADVVVQILNNDKVIYEQTSNLNPEMSFEMSKQLGGNIDTNNLKTVVLNNKGKELISFSLNKIEKPEIPDAAKPALLPSEITSIEQLYLRGLHLEQYRHVNYKAEDYYEEALNREPSDIRVNNAMGMLLMRKGEFEKAKPYFEKAVESIIRFNPNPYNGEAYFNLGMCNKYLGNNKEAYKALYKSAWNDAWQAAAYFNIAAIDIQNNDFELALEHIDKALIKNWHNHRARNLKVVALRKLNKIDEAKKYINESLEIDAFNMGVQYEKALITGDYSDFDELIRDNAHNYIEYSIDYTSFGMYDDAIAILERYVEQANEVYAISEYMMSWNYIKKNDLNTSKKIAERASKRSSDIVFPNKLEEMQALENVVKINKNDYKAFYYLGNYWYSKRVYQKAILAWENSEKINNEFPTVKRNLALAYFNKLDKPQQALVKLEDAFKLNTKDARVQMELDQLYKILNIDLEARLDKLEQYSNYKKRDDLYLQRITLLNIKGEYEEAYNLLLNNKFDPWEGGEGKATGQYIKSCTGIALSEFRKANYEKSLEYLHKAKVYPHNLGEGKLPIANDNDIDYWIGKVYAEISKRDSSLQYYTSATKGDSEPGMSFFYNDQSPDKIFYQGMALVELNREEEAIYRFDKLIKYGENHLNNEITIDYFAVSLPDIQIWDADLNKMNKIHCYYLIGLGKLGKGEYKEAKSEFKKVLELNNSHQGAIEHLNLIDDKNALLK